MGREISLFTNYSQKENSVTNYCGLLMKLIYEESPRKFQDLLELLLTDPKESVSVGPKFSQQEKKKNSIPDLSISQKSFQIFFETKTTDWFYDEQIAKHADSFGKNCEKKIIFLLSNFENENPEEKFQKEIQEAKTQNIIIKTLSFEGLADSLDQICGDDEFLKNMLEEFKIYLDRENLFPKWKYLLDVVNCSSSIDRVNQGFYVCPNDKSAYSHRRAKYFGAYSLKNVAQIFEIRAVVLFEENLSDPKIIHDNENDGAKKDLIQQAEDKLKSSPELLNENKSRSLQVFLLSEGEETNFKKDSRGGMMGSKKYFWDIACDCSNLKDLAKKLEGKEWSDYPGK